MQDLIASWARVIGVFEKLHKKRDQTAAQNKPTKEYEYAHQPGINSHFVGDIG